MSPGVDTAGRNFPLPGPEPELSIRSVRVSASFARDELTTAVEQGIHYWARVIDVTRDAEGYVIRAVVVDVENDVDPIAKRRHVVTVKKVKHAIERMIREPKKTGTSGLTKQLLDINPDACTADAACQVACFGKVLYG